MHCGDYDFQSAIAGIATYPQAKGRRGRGECSAYQG